MPPCCGLSALRPADDRLDRPEGREIARAEGAPEWSKPESVEYLKQLVMK